MTCSVVGYSLVFGELKRPDQNDRLFVVLLRPFRNSCCQGRRYRLCTGLKHSSDEWYTSKQLSLERQGPSLLVTAADIHLSLL